MLWFFAEIGDIDFVRIGVGITLIATAMLRTIPAIRKPLASLVTKRSVIYHGLMGVLHGATNLGGTMLASLAATEQVEKDKVRYTVAHYYLAFGSIQCVTMFAHGDGRALLNGVLSLPVALAAYLLFGILVFKRFTDGAYAHSGNAFMLVYGVALLARPAI